MASISEEEVLQAAIAGIPRVAEVVASIIPDQHRVRALDAVEGTYRQTVRDLGYDEGLAQSWVSAVMLRLRSEVRDQESSKPKLVQPEPEPDDNVYEIRRSEEQ